MNFTFPHDNNLQRSKLIASLLGPVLTASTLTEAINLHIYTTRTPQVTFLNGMILFVLGLAVVRFHNLWRRSWVIIITIMGWMILLSGLFRMLFPDAQQASISPVTYAVIIGLSLVGLFMTFKAYR